jgi:hypothetical protein
MLALASLGARLPSRRGHRSAATIPTLPIGANSRVCLTSSSCPPEFVLNCYNLNSAKIAFA